MAKIDIQSFLEECSISSQKAYDAFKNLLHENYEKDSIKETHDFLFLLFNYVENLENNEKFEDKYHFNFKKIIVRGKNEEIKLLQFPSIFSPEEWSFTFYEGLSRFPSSYFSGKKIVELGCGNGWICISLALNTDLDFIYGLDINPKAITCAKINLALNAFNDEGEEIKTYSGKGLWESLFFGESDLLAYCRENHIELDRIIGCIPQVLSPDPEKLIKNITEHSTDEQLYDLSNYCSVKGHVEDEFGLGLIATAIEESLQCLKAGGTVVMNLGGRPGAQILEGLFKRRGFLVNKIWSTKVIQAEDTDIQALVEIEKRTGHKFEFFMGLDAREPINAQTAEAYVKQGGVITHSLSVYEAWLEKRKEVQNIFEFLQGDEFKETRQLMDLHSNEHEVFEERVDFLSKLSNLLTGPGVLPYEKTQGKKELRENLSRFLRSYYRVPLSKEKILISPSRNEIINNVLLLFRPQTVLVDEELFDQNSQIQKMKNYYNWDINSYACPRRIGLVKELVEKLRPQLLVSFLNPSENEFEENVEQLFKVTAEYGTRLILDISDYFDISSQPQKNAVLFYLKEKPLPQHVIINCDLVKNKVYENLQLCFSLTENELLMEHLNAAAELSYSRAPFLTQYYYEVLLNGLLSFRLSEDKVIERPSSKKEDLPKNFDGLSAEAIGMLNHPSMVRERLPMDESTVRLDYGENSLPMATDLKVGIYESFVRSPHVEDESNPKEEIDKFLEENYGLLKGDEGQMIFASGVAPLFHSLARICALKNECLIFPQGTYGEFVACAQFVGARFEVCPTEEKQSFKLTPEVLNKVLKDKKGAWVFLNLPIVNPTGAFYSEKEFIELVKVIKSHKAKLVMDTIFSGLEFDSTLKKQKIGNLLGKDLDWVFMGGVSKLYAAGGLRFGFALCSSSDLAFYFEQINTFKPHFTCLYTARKIYKNFNEGNPSLLKFLAEQRSLLKKRSEILTSTLEKSGWSVLHSSGGLFLVAAPKSYFGKTVSIDDKGISKNYVLDSKNFYEVFFFSTGVLINGSEWTGIPNYCRFVLSVSEEEFKKGLEAIKSFRTMIGN